MPMMTKNPRKEKVARSTREIEEVMGTIEQYLVQTREVLDRIEENITESCEPIIDESFVIRSEGSKIIISADGYLGTLWGIYTFCERFLGIDPCYLFNDFEIKKVEALEIADIYIDDKPKSFGFRGVFINDEDFLTDWKDGGGPRHMDYPYYNNTVAPSVMDMVVETVLRNKMNLVIPATFLDIDNPP